MQLLQQTARADAAEREARHLRERAAREQERYEALLDERAKRLLQAEVGGI